MNNISESRAIYPSSLYVKGQVEAGANQARDGVHLGQVANLKGTQREQQAFTFTFSAMGNSE